jgi:thiol-disulfide isomerase/thioredoxin
LRLTAFILLALLATQSRALDLSAYHGKTVYLDFWASWCGPCRQSFPWMAQMQQRYQEQGLVIIAVNVDQDRALADKFLAQVPHPFTIEFDANGTLAETYQVAAMPSSIVIDKNGQIIARHAGFFEKNLAQYEQHLREALKH